MYTWSPDLSFLLPFLRGLAYETNLIPAIISSYMLYGSSVCLLLLIISEYMTLYVIVICSCCYSANKLRHELNLYQLQENRQIKPKTFMHKISNTLYTRR